MWATARFDHDIIRGGRMESLPATTTTSMSQCCVNNPSGLYANM